MNAQAIYSFIILLLASIQTCLGDIIKDPESDFLTRSGIKLKATITTIEADLNNDGIDDQLITKAPLTYSNPSGATESAPLWYSYLSVPGGYYVDQSNQLKFTTDAVHYDYVKSLKQKALIIYIPINITVGTLVAIYAKNNKISRTKIGELHLRDNQKDKAFYRQYFQMEGYQKIYKHMVEITDSLAFPDDEP